VSTHSDGGTVHSMVVDAGWAGGPKLLLSFLSRMLVEHSSLAMTLLMRSLTRWISLSSSSKALEMSSSCGRKRAEFGSWNGFSLVDFIGGSYSFSQAALKQKLR
jgi:hypothetical protein